MSATNSTLNYELPQFIATDKPAWLVDFNGAMSTIDTAIKEAKTAGDNAQATANTNAANIQTLDGTVTSQGTALGVLSSDVAGNTGSINTINSLIGNGQPTTTDKTIIGAINEINAKVGDVEAENVSFNNANTGLVATDVQAAIVEVKGLVATPDAEDVAYDNTTSLLSATDVQSAIDEVNGKFGGSQIRYNSSTQSMQYSADGGVNWANFSSALSLDEVESAIATIASGNTGTTGNLSGTQTYTFLEDHAEVLVTCQGFLVGYNDVTGGGTATHDISVTGTISGSQTVNLFHDDNEYITGSATVAGPLVKMDRKTYHIEDVKAGDVLTLSYATDFTYVRASTAKLEADYVIMTVN